MTEPSRAQRAGQYVVAGVVAAAAVAGGAAGVHLAEAATGPSTPTTAAQGSSTDLQPGAAASAGESRHGSGHVDGQARPSSQDESATEEQASGDGSQPTASRAVGAQHNPATQAAPTSAKRAVAPAPAGGGAGAGSVGSGQGGAPVARSGGS